MYTVCTLYVDCIYTVCTLYTLYVHCMYTVCTLFVHCTYLGPCTRQERQEAKVTGLLMGKLKEDMDFLGTCKVITRRSVDYNFLRSLGTTVYNIKYRVSIVYKEPGGQGRIFGVPICCRGSTGGVPVEVVR